jgi:hypothetical protein
VLFIAGEAGIGKTTLVEAYVDTLGRQEIGWVSWGQCVDAYGPSTGYLPVLEDPGRLCQGPAGVTALDHLRQWAPTWLAQLAGVVPPGEHARLQRHTQGVTRERLLRELAEALEALTATHLLVLEDLHWSDALTVDVLALLARRREAARLLVIGTYRPTGLVVWPDGTLSGQYRFRHALYQQVLYRRLLAVQRVQGHQHVGTRLEVGYGARADEIAAELVVHFEQGHDYRRAVQYVLEATRNAARRGASQEVIALATKGVTLLARLSEVTEYLQQELDLQVALSQALIVTQGYAAPDLGRICARARELCEQIGDTQQIFPVLRGLMLYYLERRYLQTTSQLGEQLLSLAQAQNDPAFLMLAHYMLWPWARSSTAGCGLCRGRASRALPRCVRVSLPAWPQGPSRLSRTCWACWRRRMGNSAIPKQGCPYCMQG